MNIKRSVAMKIAVAAAAAMSVAGCVHREPVGYGSIKDSGVASPSPARVAGSVKRVAAAPASRAAGSRVVEIEAPAPRAGSAGRAPAAAASTSTSTGAATPTSAQAAEVPAATDPAARRTPPAAVPAARAALPGPAVVAPPRPRSEQDARMVSLQLLSEGSRLFTLGKVLEARKRYFAAMDGPVPEVLLALARTFDVFYLSKLQQPDGAPDMARALALYERAAERGSVEAKADLQRIRGEPAGQPGEQQAVPPASAPPQR